MTAPLLYLLIMVKAIETEKAVLVICKMLRYFIKAVTADDKYSLLNRDYLTQPIHMLLSIKKIFFPTFFFIFKI